MISGQEIRFIELDGLGVLPDVVGVVNAAGQTFEVSRLNCFELPDAEFGSRSDGFEADAPIGPPGFYAENAFVSHGLTACSRYYNVSIELLKEFSVSLDTVWYTAGRKCS